MEGKEELSGPCLFPSYPENAGFEETCREFLTTEDTGSTEVTSGNLSS
jgi:hypothetical protein